MPLTRREMLGTTALAAVAAADMLGPNGSWGPLVWPSDDPPPVRLSADFEAAITGKVIELRGHARAEAKAEVRGLIIVNQEASNRQTPEITA